MSITPRLQTRPNLGIVIWVIFVWAAAVLLTWAAVLGIVIAIWRLVWH